MPIRKEAYIEKLSKTVGMIHFSGQVNTFSCLNQELQFRQNISEEIRGLTANDIGQTYI